MKSTNNLLNPTFNVLSKLSKKYFISSSETITDGETLRGIPIFEP